MNDKESLAGNYILKTGDNGSKGLEEQHNFLADDSYVHIKKAGLSSGIVVADIGCGTGTMSEFISSEIGKDGYLYCVDASQNQLDYTKKRLVSRGYKNFETIRADVQERIYLEREVDIAYARLVFMHLHDPLAALKNLYSLLKKSGKVVLQESIMSSIYSSLDIPIIDEYFDILIALGRAKGADYNIGLSLDGICMQAGFKNVSVYKIQKSLNPETTKNVLHERLIEWGHHAVDADIISQERLNELYTQIQELDKYGDFDFFPSEQCFIIAEK